MCACRKYQSVFCSIHHEIVEHLFLRYNLTIIVWDKVREWLGISRSMMTLKSTIKWIKKEHKGALVLGKAITLVFASPMFFIWKFRNDLIFDNKHAITEDIVKAIKFNVYRVLHFYYPRDMVTF